MILPIVEGKGEVDAVPVLVRRIAASYVPERYVTVERPIRRMRSDLVQPNGLERVIELAARQTGPADGILVLLDADDDCPVEVAANLRARAERTRPDRHVRVVVASREFEAWFLAAAESLRGVHGLAADLAPPANPESIRDAKGWLTARTRSGHSYKPAVDQAALSQLFDLEQAATARSFRKFIKDVVELARLSA